MVEARFQAAPSYLEDEGLLDLLLDRSPSPAAADPIPPDMEDLARLHRLIRERMAFTVLEFGIGYSTIIICDALAKNEIQWSQLQDPPKIRNRFMWRAFALDASEHWITTATARIPQAMQIRLEAVHSPVTIGTFEGQLCHYYDSLPDVNPDFVYLDGPDPKDVAGSIHGLSFECEERTVMAGDLLLMESTLLPGAFVLIDGRTNNARFLARNFRRPWDHRWYPKEDVTTFELMEDRLGPHNILGTDPFEQSQSDTSGA